MTKRGLIFSIAYHPYVGGAEVAIKEITDRIPEVHFDMITLRFTHEAPRFEKIGNVAIHRIGIPQKGNKKSFNVMFPYSLNKYLFPFTACLYALRLNRKHSYDFTWAMMANYAGFAALFFKIIKPRIPYLLSLQEGDPFEHIKKRVGFLHPIFKMIFKKADHIQAISTYLVSFARENGYKGEVSVVPNGVDTKLFRSHLDQSEIERYKTLVGKKDISQDRNYKEPKILITTSRLVKKNGVDLLIKAMSFLSDDIHLVIIGDGPDMQELKEIADSMPGEKITFLGSVDNKEIHKYLRASDVFVRPSRSEGFGISFIEAMAARLPVVTAPVGGITDFLFDGVGKGEDEQTGYFCETENPQSIAHEVMRCLKDKEVRDKVIDNAEKLVLSKYDWNTIVPQMKEIISNLTK